MVGGATIQIEPPTNAIVAFDPAIGRRRLAGLRDWVDEWGVEHAVLYLPGDIVWWQRDASTKSWTLDEVGSGRNPLGVVPLVPLPNAPTLRERQGRSDVERVIPLQNAVNKLCGDMIIASEYAAFPQRWATGIEIPVTRRRGSRCSRSRGFLGGADELWGVEADTGKFGDFPVCGPRRSTCVAIEMLIQHIAAQTRTPPHYLLGAMG